MASMKFFPDWLRNMFKFSNDFYLRNYYMIGQKGPVWIDTLKPYELYSSIPQLQSVVDRKASMFSNMELKLIKLSDGSEIEDEELNTLLQNPNVMQSLNEWLKQFKQQECIYGNQFIYKNKPSRLSNYPASLLNISPYYIQPILTGKLFDQTTIDGIISGYQYTEEGRKRIFDGKDILYTRIIDLDNPIVGRSLLLPLKYPLGNIKLAYEYRNVIMGELGAPKIISSNYKDSIGSKALTKEEKDEISDEFTGDYGVQSGKRKVKIVSSNIQVIDNAFPTKELMLFEEIEANMLTIIDQFGMNVNLFSNKNATFENIKNSIIQTYQDTIIPEADQFTQSLSKFLNVPKGTRLVASYEHLAILKESKQQGMNVISTIVGALNQAVAGGILKQAQATKILESEMANMIGDV